MIIGTAGHIDHGKTSLVRALTGADTDRLPEEKARGISIELGYAYVPLANGEVLGFVDVPGHERFVHTMLAGATGIDFALLVVAADDGVMPQTREHLNIVTLLGVRTGAVALTKIDAVDSGRVTDVEQELRVLLANTALADVPIFAVSSRLGTGIEALRAYLEHRAQEHVGIGSDDAYFRLAVDRSFSMQGLGTVVTGTVHSGRVQVGDNVIVVPGGGEVRVRSIHAQDRATDAGTAGQRCALNLVGISHDQVSRGDWIVAPPAALSVERFDARLALLPGEAKAMRSGAMVHIHLGSVHVSARIVLLEAETSAGEQREEIEPGTSALVQCILQRPIGAWHGDRFIVRDGAASRTIGGGRVLDPFAPQRYRRNPQRLAVLRTYEAPTAEMRFDALIENSPFGVDLGRLRCGGNVRHLDRLLEPSRVKRIEYGGTDFAIGDRHWLGLQAQVAASLAAFHRDHVDELGPDSARLKRMVLPKLGEGVFRALLGDMIAVGTIRRTGPWLHLPEHSNAPSPQERALVDRILPRLLDARFDPPWVRDLAKDLSQPELQLRSAMIRASKRGELFQIVRDLFYHPVAIRNLAALANGLQDADGEVRAAAFRDGTGLGRKRAIQILEFFDRVGFTRRVSDRHIVRTDNLLLLNDPLFPIPDATGDGPVESRQSA